MPIFGAAASNNNKKMPPTNAIRMFVHPSSQNTCRNHLNVVLCMQMQFIPHFPSHQVCSCAMLELVVCNIGRVAVVAVARCRAFGPRSASK